jgi:dipeptidyl aminopeptidase/acylaminoacyl peptidase
LIHGEADDDVPCAISQRYAERKKKMGEKVELITLPRTGHYEIVDPESKAWSKVQQTFVSLTRA